MAKVIERDPVQHLERVHHRQLSKSPDDSISLRLQTYWIKASIAPGYSKIYAFN